MLVKDNLDIDPDWSTEAWQLQVAHSLCFLHPKLSFIDWCSMADHVTPLRTRSKTDHFDVNEELGYDPFACRTNITGFRPVASRQLSELWRTCRISGGWQHWRGFNSRIQERNRSGLFKDQTLSKRSFQRRAEQEGLCFDWHDRCWKKCHSQHALWGKTCIWNKLFSCFGDKCCSSAGLFLRWWPLARDWHTWSRWHQQMLWRDQCWTLRNLPLCPPWHCFIYCGGAQRSVYFGNGAAGSWSSGYLWRKWSDSSYHDRRDKKCRCSWKIAGWHHATAPRSHAEALVWTRQSACLASGECQGTCHCRISIDSTSRCWWNSWAQQWREILGATVHTFSGTGEIFQIGLTTSSVFHKVDRGGEVSKASDHLWLSRSSQRSNILRF